MQAADAASFSVSRYFSCRRIAVRRITRYLLWIFIFSVPCGIESTIAGLGTVTRLLGLLTTAFGACTVFVEGRVRKPGAIFWLALVFATSALLSLFWTVSYSGTTERVGTYIQYVGLIWLVFEFARTREEQHSLRLAFCLGGLVFVADLLRNFALGANIGGTGETRYSASFINPNFVGFTLVTGFPMAWQLFLDHRGAVRAIASLYCAVAPLTVILTASRSSFLALLVTVSIVPLTLPRKSMRSLLQVTVVLFAAGVAIGFVVPGSSWDRLLTTGQELQGGTMSGRTDIWGRAWSAFQERPFLGGGANAFGPAIDPGTTTPHSAHNSMLALLVEQGVVGLCLFCGLLAACTWAIIGLPSRERRVWAASMLAWLIFAMAHDAHSDRVTWVVFGMLAAQAGVRKRAYAYVPEPTLRLAQADADNARLRPISARRMTASR